MNVTRKHVHIGIGVPLSGNSRALGMEMKHAAELALQDRNAIADSATTEVVSVVLDDEGTPVRGEGIARQLSDDPDLLGVVGHYNSDVTIAAARVYDAAGVPMITPIASSPTLTDAGWSTVFRLTNRDDSTARAISRHLHRTLGKRRAVVIESPTAYGHSMASCFIRAFEATGGAILGVFGIAEGERHFDALIRRLPADVDLFFYGGSFEGAPLLRALRARGLNQLFAAGDGCWDVRNFLEPAGDVAQMGEGVLVLAASLPSDSGVSSHDVAQRYVRRHGLIGNYALNSYDATRVLLSAVDRAVQARGSAATPGDVVDALKRISCECVSFSGRLAWDVKRDNVSAVTVLHVVRDHGFAPIAIYGREQRLVVGIDDALPPPMQMGDPARGDFRGYEVDLLNALARGLDLELRYRRAPWSQLLLELSNHTVDMLCSAATVTPDRQEDYSFSRPYLPVSLAIVSRVDRPVSRLGPDCPIGVRDATAAEAHASAQNAHVVRRSECNDELYEALKSGAIDAVLDDAPIATFFVQAIEGLRMDALPGTESTYAFVVRKTDRPLRERIDAVIEVLERDGELDRLRERWRLS